MQKSPTGQSRGNCKKALFISDYSNSQSENQESEVKFIPPTGINLEKPCKACGYGRANIFKMPESSFAARCGNCDIFQYFLSDAELELVANFMPVRCGDE